MCTRSQEYEERKPHIQRDCLNEILHSWLLVLMSLFTTFDFCLDFCAVVCRYACFFWYSFEIFAGARTHHSLFENIVSFSHSYSVYLWQFFVLFVALTHIYDSKEGVYVLSFVSKNCVCILFCAKQTNQLGNGSGFLCVRFVFLLIRYALKIWLSSKR